MSLQDASSQGNYGVRINVLCPAFVDTPLLHSVEHEDNMGKFVKFKDDFKRSMDKFGVLQWVQVLLRSSGPLTFLEISLKLNGTEPLQSGS